MNTSADRPREKRPFVLKSAYEPRGDQPTAIAQLVEGFQKNNSAQVLLGVTGSGKTFTMANTIAKLNKPALVLAHNKTLAAQLHQELKAFFPENAVEYFVSYYDYYQPEAYVPSTDTYIEKDAMINDAIDRMRHAATRALLERTDVIIVASVSCIYGIGSSQSYQEMTTLAEVGQRIKRDSFLRQLVESQYERNDVSFARGTFRVRGDIVEVFPAHEEETALRIAFFGDEIEQISVIDPLRGKTLRTTQHVTIWPASHYATTLERRQRAMDLIRNELTSQLTHLRDNQFLVEAQRLEQRTTYDLEMLESTGACKGVENYSRHLTGRSTGEPPPTLLDYFPTDFLLIIDESHQTIPQLRAMYHGDKSRKEMLVRYGFRMPSALDNRPLRFEELRPYMRQTLYVSATPSEYELRESGGVAVEQLIRPTGLLDPEVEVRPVLNQVDDLLAEAQKAVSAGDRVLVTTLTKKMSEDLTEYLIDVGVKAKYLHSDIDTLERISLLAALRRGEYNVLVGINLLREGLDLPEVALVAILDADKEGFLRSATGLIQTIGRAARNVRGRAILYGDHITDAMRIAIDETKRRRAIQLAHNKEHNITPQTTKRVIHDVDPSLLEASNNQEDANLVDRFGSKFTNKTHNKRRDAKATEKAAVKAQAQSAHQLVDQAPDTTADLLKYVEGLRRDMQSAAKNLDFERAAALRDAIRTLEPQLLL